MLDREFMFELIIHGAYWSEWEVVLRREEETEERLVSRPKVYN